MVLSGPDTFAGTADQFEVELFTLAHRFPAELHGFVAARDPFAGDVTSFSSVATKEDACVGFDATVMFAAEQRVHGQAELLSFQIPERHVHSAHGGDGDGGASEILGAAQDFLPKALGFEGVFADEDFAQTAGNVVAEGGVDDSFDHFGRGVGLPYPFESIFVADADEDNILAAGGFRDDFLQAKHLANDLVELHEISRRRVDQAIEVRQQTGVPRQNACYFVFFSVKSC
jgi:hypothetical protein